ncbi:MAG: 23S rRNA (cytidine(2498)-2'-O)-methyltransferase RlmM [Halopseudomonas sp.]
MNHLILYCRPGFEPECAAEINDLATQAGVPGYAKTDRGDGYVVYISHLAEGATQLLKLLVFSKLVFARQWFASPGLVEHLPAADRITPLVERLSPLPQCGELMIETADTNEAKSLAGFCRKFTSPCAQTLRQKGILSPKRTGKLPRLHLFFLDSERVYPGVSYPGNHARQEMGIPRLKFPAAAPSRSTLKLDEAFLHFLTADQRERLLAPAMRAVDLGAAPGGWTWQLVKRHLRVVAVDNGPMAESLMDSGLVKHVREDGFRYQPQRSVQWMVCDMADQPSKVAKHMALWLEQGWSERIIFNLKLPMKKRYQAVCECQELVRSQLEQAGVAYQLDMKQLYHDREEVTCYLRRS